MSNIFDQGLRRLDPAAFAAKHNLQHREAFCLMWYECQCGHRERVWNSRDGVTPFCMACPSCGQPKLYHVEFKRDEYAPDHKPTQGQRVWIDMTNERAEYIARARIAMARASGRDIDDSRLPDLRDSLLGLEHGGGAPDLKVFGYATTPEA